MKFIVDTMLGKLGRWMLFLGYDVLYYRGQSDEGLIQKAKAEGRIIITRDTRLALEREPRNSFLIKTIHFWEQLRRITEAFPQNFTETLFSRCSHCGALLEAVKKEEILTQIPEKVREMATDFSRCPSCLHLYWNGTHTLRIIQLLKEKAGIQLT
ncbi:Mut7-C RNAse domain-containing protein [Candidatus Sumerlaeota bacterium]|nr:Mut7-C RNAse domain-containing protein [Candidatus Sumerlaeota bacterium]